MPECNLQHGDSHHPTMKPAFVFALLMQEGGICIASEKSIQPVLTGFEILNLTPITFLLNYPSLSKRLLFDGGTHENFTNHFPATKRRLHVDIRGLNVEGSHNAVEDADTPLGSRAGIGITTAQLRSARQRLR